MTEPDAVDSARTERLRRLLDGAPDGWVRAPGRVNLIGDHTDYQDGWCLPMAIDRDVVVAWRRTGDEVVARSADLDGTARSSLAGAVTDATPSWGVQVAATVVALHERGITPVGTELSLASTVPLGSGLSSSAAFGVAVALALSTAAESPLDGTELALVAQRAEHIVGVPCGLLDQMASVHGKAGHALLLDCRDLTVDPLPLPSHLSVLVVHCGLPRALADSAYAERRTACEAAAARLDIATLRDASAAMVHDDRFARHVVSENERVLAFAAALRDRDDDALGDLMVRSHESLSTDFAVSTPELDRLVELLLDHGAIGARMTGGGFGGCVVALAATDRAPHVLADVTQRYRAATALEPLAFVARASDGAGPVDPNVVDRTDEEHA